MRVVIDHIAGSRAGQRQEFPAAPEGPPRVRFGRHPECEVSFDPHRDIDASSRHAELRAVPAASDGGEPRWVLVDLGSSNGTYVDGHRVTEAQIAASTPLVIEFGPGGPRIRLFIGAQAEIEALPPAPVEARTLPWLPIALGGVLMIIVLVVLVARC